jgi:UDP-2,3-diacylglucosamine hydrolase
MNNHTIFISDLHLSPTEPKITILFFKFLKELTPQTEALYILGDFFKFWAGDDNRSAFNEEIKRALKTTSIKIPIYFMPGNRDFILGEVFAKESGCTLIPDPYKINLYNRPTLLTHGDILSHDIKHRAFRIIIRFPYGIKLFLKLPLKIRIKIARTIQKYSARVKLTTNNKEFAPQPNIIKKFMNQFNTNQLIHGHTHKVATKDFSLDGQPMRRISLGAWDNNHGSILLYYPDGQFEFKNFI